MDIRMSGLSRRSKERVHRSMVWSTEPYQTRPARPHLWLTRHAESLLFGVFVSLEVVAICGADSFTPRKTRRPEESIWLGHLGQLLGPQRAFHCRTLRERSSAALMVSGIVETWLVAEAPIPRIRGREAADVGV